MPLLNIGLQSIGLTRKQIDDEFEAAVAKCKNMKQLRAAAEKNPTIKDGILDSIAPMKLLMSSVFHRLSLKEKKVESFAIATTAEIEEFLSSIKSVHESVTADVKWIKAVLPEIFKPTSLPSDVFEEIKFHHDPVTNDGGHYKPFEVVYGKTTSEKHRSTLQKRPARIKTLPFVSSVQNPRNTNMMIQCEECEMWRLVYSMCKLTAVERLQLDNALSDYTYTCGATLSDLDLNGRLADVCIRDIQCYDPLEKLYFSMNKDPICIYCCGSANLVTKEGCYPQCNNCDSKPSLSLSNSCPVPTPPSTPMETKGQKSSTIRALYFNDPVVTSPSTSVVRNETDTNMTLTDSEQIVNICSSSEDDTSDSDVTTDSDDDYICSELDNSAESDEEELKNERKFIVFESMLDQLFINCNTCGSLCEIEKSNTGSMVVIKATCCNNHTFHWRSQPEIDNKPAGNILIPAATVITGGSYESMKQFSNALNLNFVNKDQF
ncbi:Hypothetical predicted protein [Paramuricea clavata]|uniref:Uncharacterized protein n=1 Tax=Paramuricea clavata TaxID=317549 RepID=A0A6S7KUL5_PARCT|nr:Hypothetical predicted protein [Paramuricea clavata]